MLNYMAAIEKLIRNNMTESFSGLIVRNLDIYLGGMSKSTKDSNTNG
jgi:hypothetical protein